MSNIKTAAAWHGLDDEPNEDGTRHCKVCWSAAKTKFFAAKFHRKGETLAKLYIQIHEDAHQYR
jgi:hypothetical protein